MIKMYTVYNKKYQSASLTKIGDNNHKDFLKLIKPGMYTNFPIRGRTKIDGYRIYKVIK